MKSNCDVLLPLIDDVYRFGKLLVAVTFPCSKRLLQVRQPGNLQVLDEAHRRFFHPVFLRLRSRLPHSCNTNRAFEFFREDQKLALSTLLGSIRKFWQGCLKGNLTLLLNASEEHTFLLLSICDGLCL